jgi:heat-inducible transcriptional repressor
MAVLRAVIGEYVETCAPVGSKVIVDNYDLGVSSATVRGDLSRLEGSGHLAQPHVSAGRIPTDLGYRAVVDDDLSAGLPRMGARPHVSASSTAEAMRQIAVALADMTRCLAIVSSPVSHAAHVARVSLVPTQTGSAVLVVVCDDGRVDSRPVGCEGLSADDLAGVEQALSDLFVGQDVSDVDPARVMLGGAADVLLARLAARVRALVARSGEGTRASAGVPLLLAHPEFHDAERVRVVVGALEDDDIDFDDILADERGGLVVRIGSENPDKRLATVSFVAKEYRAGDGVGFVACVGPTRMDYRMTIGAVEAGACEAACVYAGSEA